jgi:chromosome segregation protein
MYLKSIEIQGFKSFANKTRLEFHQGFTGIVGPNGSGKSNVADAVRWVLGEQRVKQLRGGSMQDVIFAGTELRKPQSYAYVAITLDNSDHRLPVEYKEVTVARKLWRSGESVYLINNVQVRLRDVQELFYDTGIGKEGYSIIGQGQIEKILSDKPEDRRELFDEAAGIVKYKRRKADSLKKLDSEQANLVRVTDILSELEKQVGPLEKQAEKAQIYLKAHEELKKNEVNVFLLENGNTRDKIREFDEKIKAANEALESAEDALNASKENYEKNEQRLQDLNGELENTRNEVSNASIVRGQLEGNIRLYEEQIRAARSNAEHFEERKSALSRQIAEKNTQKQEIEEKKSGVDGEIRALEEKQLAAQEEQRDTQNRISALQTKIDESRNAIVDLLSERASIKAQQASLDTRTQQIREQKDDLARRIEEAANEKEEHEKLLDDLKKDLDEVTKSLSSYESQQKELDDTIASMKQTLTDADESYQDAQLSYHQAKTKLDTLVNLTERYEGYGNGVRRVMQEKDRESGIVGVVADLIKTNQKYETAIETALGGAIQNVVTKDEETTKRLIGMLKREKAGKVTFLPITNLHNQTPFNMTGALREPGIIGLASTLVRTPAGYEEVAEALLGRIVVADTFDHASACERKYGHRIRMVTLDGELFSPGGAISGGAYRNNSNLLGRRREIADLKKQVESSHEAMEASDEKIQETKRQRNILRGRLETVRMEYQNTLMRQNAAKINLEQEKKRQEETSEGVETLIRTKADLEKSDGSLDEKRQEIQNLLSLSQEKENRKNEETDALRKDLEALRLTQEKQSGCVNEIGLEIEKKKQSISYEEQELKRLSGEIESLTGELSEVEESIRGGGSEVEDKKAKIEETKKTIEASKVSEENSRKLLDEKTKEQEELSARQKELIGERDHLAEEKAQYAQEAERLDAKKERLAESLDDQISYMWQEYEITLTEAEALRDETMSDIPAMQKTIRELKAKIKDLGAVNVNAIEEYNTIHARYVEYKTQYDDLTKAADALRKIISDLDEKMRTQFKNSFARIQEEFDEVFRELFGGGSGKLELEEDQDLLEAGVRVIAQPPGKKLVNMMQMSGGEKSLTAISLLFAIQNLKPSPFCLLDEIEAALDESNVVRFARYIHKLTSSTQFIVITHRRGTMDEADRLYGITMQEKGVSTLVSVDLIDDKDLAS